MTQEIKLTRGMVAVVCDCHVHLVNSQSWRAVESHHNGRWYARNSKGVSMHSVIHPVPSGAVTDHIDKNSLNNQCSNLRTASLSQNMFNRTMTKANKTGYKGVTFSVRDNRWRAHIGIGGKRISLGDFKDPKEAAKAYDAAAKTMHGEFAALNFTDSTNE